MIAVPGDFYLEQGMTDDLTLDAVATWPLRGGYRAAVALMADQLPRPRKRFGQNFLTDRNVLTRIVESAGILPGEPVLEIGPGGGR